MEMMNLQNKYKSPSYANYNNNPFFDDHYQRYLAQVQQEVIYDDVPSQQKQSSSGGYSDHTQEDYEDIPSLQDENARSGGQRNEQVDVQDIEIFGLDYSEFAKKMSDQYGGRQFQEGFALISKHKDLIYTEEGENQLVQMVKRIFGSEELTKGFLNYCISFMIVQNSQLQFAQ